MQHTTEINQCPNFERHGGPMWSQNAKYCDLYPGTQAARNNLPFLPGNLNSSYSLDTTEVQSGGHTGAVWRVQNRGHCGVTPGDQNVRHNADVTVIQNTGGALSETGSQITGYGHSPNVSQNTGHCGIVPSNQNVVYNLSLPVTQNAGCELGTIENLIEGRGQSRWRHQNTEFYAIPSGSQGNGYCGNSQGNQNQGFNIAPPRNHFDQNVGSDARSLFGAIVRTPQASQTQVFSTPSKETSFRGQREEPPGSPSTGYCGSATPCFLTEYDGSATVATLTRYSESGTLSTFTGYAESATQSPSAKYGRSATGSPSTGFGGSAARSPFTEYGGSATVGPSTGYGRSATRIPSTGYGGSATGTPFTEYSGSAVTRIPSTGYGRSATRIPFTGYGGSATGTPFTEYSGSATRIPSTGYGRSATGTPFTEYSGSATGTPFTEYSGSAIRIPSTGYGRSATRIPSTGYGGFATGTPFTEYSGSATRIPSTGYGGSATGTPFTEYSGSATGTLFTEYSGSATQSPSTGYGGSATGTPFTEYSGSATQSPSTGYGGSATGTPFAEYSGSATQSPSTGYGGSATGTPFTEYSGSATQSPSTGYGGSATGTPFTEYSGSAIGDHSTVYGRSVTQSPFREYSASATGRPSPGYGGSATLSPLTDYSELAIGTPFTECSGSATSFSTGYGGSAQGCPRTDNDGVQPGTKGTGAENHVTSGPCPLSAISGKQQEAGDDDLTSFASMQVQIRKSASDDADGSKEDLGDRDDTRVETFTLSLTDGQVARLADKESNQALEEIQKKTGDEVYVDPNLSSAPGMMTVTFRGTSSQVNAADQAVIRRTSAKGKRRMKSAGGGRVKVYLHAVTDAQADLLCKLRGRGGKRGRKRGNEEDTAAVTAPNSCGGNIPVFQVIKQKTGADVQFDRDPSPVQGMKIIIIRGLLSQIEAASDEIIKKTGSKATMSSQAQTFWLQWVQEAFPDLDSRAYFLPPVHFNRVHTTRQSVAGQEVLVLRSAPGEAGQSNPAAAAGQSCVARADTSQTADSNDVLVHQTSEQSSPPSNQPIIPCGGKKSSAVCAVRVQNSDVRDNAAMQRVLFCLQEMCEKKGEVLVGMSNLNFGQYLGEPCYAAAAAQLPRHDNLPPALPQNWKQGDFDVLLIHRHYGIVVCAVKAFGDNVKALGMSQQDISKQICKKLREATKYLDKAGAVLSHLVSDVASRMRITKTIALPNLTAHKVQEAVSIDPQVAHELRWCLRTTDLSDIAGLCLCSDQLSDPKTPRDVSRHVLRELGNWWQRRVAVSGPDSHMSVTVYRALVARFCGPATTVTVPCTSPPRLCVKTLGQAVSWTGECYTAQITLFPEQVDLINTAPPRLFLTGPPGTGKTVVLLLMAVEWLRCGHNVHIVRTWKGSRAACCMLYHLLLQIVTKELTAVASPSQLHLVEYDLSDTNVEMAVNDLSQAAIGGPLYVLADEAVHDAGSGAVFKAFCEKLLMQVLGLHLWAASYFHAFAPKDWQVEHVTKPLRSPPVVVREVARDRQIGEGCNVRDYSDRGVPDHTDGPSLKRIDHAPHWNLRKVDDCTHCGQKLAEFLNSVRTPVSEKYVTASRMSTPPCLQWRDMLVLENKHRIHECSVLITELRKARIPVRVMKDDDIEDVATARSDVVWVADGDRVRGLERKVVVCLESYQTSTPQNRLHNMSRCTSQLVVISGNWMVSQMRCERHKRKRESLAFYEKFHAVKTDL